MNHEVRFCLLAVAVIVLVASICAHAVPDSTTEFEAECRAFVELANSNPYGSLVLPGDYDYEGAANIRPKFAQVPAIAERIMYGDGILYRHIDVDGDDVPDHVAITTGGTAHVNEAFVIATSTPDAELHLGGLEDGRVGLGVNLIRINGRHFFLSPVEGELTLWTVRNGQFLQACLLSKKEDRTRIVSSADAICDKFSVSNPNYVTYPAQHAFTKLPNEGRFWSWYPIPGLARIDIDNNGLLDDVTRIHFASGAGRGCDKTYVAMLDEALGSVPENVVNDQLEKMEGHCGPDMELFTYEGRTYLENRYDDGSRTIGFFNHTTFHQVCTFEAVRTYEWTH